MEIKSCGMWMCGRVVIVHLRHILGGTCLFTQHTFTDWGSLLMA